VKKYFLCFLLSAFCFGASAQSILTAEGLSIFGSSASVGPVNPTNYYYFTNYAGGSTIANVSNLVFTLTNTPTYQPTPPTPYSPFVLANESFQSGLGSLKVTAAGTGTLTASGGTLSYIISSPTTLILSETNNFFITPQCVVGLSVTALTNATCAFGLMTADGQNGIICSFPDFTTGDGLRLSSANGASFATHVPFLPVTNHQAFSVALEMLHNIVNVWTNSGTGWGIAGSVSSDYQGPYDLRNSTNLAAWSPAFYVYNTSGAGSIYLTNFNATYFNGPGGTREVSLVHNLDLTSMPTNSNGRYMLGLDRSTVPGTIGKQDPSTSFQIHEYDPATRTLYPAIVNIGGIFSNTPSALAEAAVVHDDAIHGYHIFSDNFTTLDFGNTGVRIWYGFVPDAGFTNTFNVTLAPVAVVADGIGVDMYGPDVIYVDPYWYMTMTEWTGSNWRTRLVKGSSPTNFNTQIATDITIDSEGVNFYRLGTNIQIAAGSFVISNSVRGYTELFDTANLTALNPIGFLNVSNLNTTTAEPQQPAIAVFPDSHGNLQIQYIGFQDNDYQGKYQASGNFIIEGTEWHQVHVQQ